MQSTRADTFEDQLLRAAPLWSSFLMLGSCYTLFDAPFWGSRLQSSVGVSNDGPYYEVRKVQRRRFI